MPGGFDPNSDPDIWQLPDTQAERDDNHEAWKPAALCIELPPAPLAASSPTLTASVPDGLHAALFAALPEGDDYPAERILETFAVLDAAKIVNLPELLESSGLEHRCLFTGRAFDDLANVAPWLVRLEEGSKFTRNLLTAGDAPWQLWRTEPALFMRSAAAFDDIWRHIRKFTRLQDDAGTWLLFRFWETGYLHDYFRHFIPIRPDLIRRLCITREGQPIHFVTGALGLSQFQILMPRADLATTPAAAMILHQEEREFLRAMRWRQNSFEMARDLKTTYPAYLADAELTEVYRRVDMARSLMRSHGIRNRSLIARYVMIATVYMPEIQDSASFRASLNRPGVAPEQNLSDFFDILKLKLNRSRSAIVPWW